MSQLFSTPDTPCREYPILNKDGYGERRRHSPRMLHRWVMAQVYGEDAIKGKVVCHRCDNRACYRFDHLVLADRDWNNKDMTAKGRHGRVDQRKTHCPQGHPYEGENIRWVEGAQRCRTCDNARAREYQRRRRAAK